MREDLAEILSEAASSDSVDEMPRSFRAGEDLSAPHAILEAEITSHREVLKAVSQDA